MNFDQLLNKLRSAAFNEHDKGDRFERLMAAYLATDPQYANQFDQIWRWADWPLRWGADAGIDLVAKLADSDEYCAIQCKFYAAEATIDRKLVDSFLAESGRKYKDEAGEEQVFAQRLFIATTDNMTSTAVDTLNDQSIPTNRLRLGDLRFAPVDWSQFSWEKPDQLTLLEKKTPRKHQREAMDAAIAGFQEHDRGRLIMACGTGKTFTALKLAEEVVAESGTVLVLLPSIALVSQTLREWTAEAEKSFHAFAVCSDTKIGRNNEDLSANDLALPATTKAASLAAHVQELHGKRDLTVVFSTYHSLQVIADAQGKGLPDFDLVICDEAHRTTGATMSGTDDSTFVKIHDPQFVKAKKRVYMTATPRIYAESTKAKANENDATLYSMDDEAAYGPEFYRLGFGRAVEEGLLTDYRVLILAVDENHISRSLQKTLADADNELVLDDAVKIIGCWNGLAKRMHEDQASPADKEPMRRAVAFSHQIKHSKHLVKRFKQVVDAYIKEHPEIPDTLNCELDHVDGSHNAIERNKLLDWLRADAGEDTCRILSNARCLSEGVDVPALDAVLFLNPRNSIVDVVQSVGRVMRRAPGKEYGYIILPIGIPAGVEPSKALDDNKRYRVVWQVLQALRAHDDRFNATVNKLELNNAPPETVQVIGVGGATEENEDGAPTPPSTEAQMAARPYLFPMDQLEAWKEAIYAKMVLKCGDRRYWEQWARDVAQIAEKHIARINGILASDPVARASFDEFLDGLHANINPAISQEEAIEMLSQHLITRPIFNAIFEGYDFSDNNPVSQSMQGILDVLEERHLSKEVESLEKFYASVRKRVDGVDNAEGRQRIVIELYDKFFKTAFPRMAERLGIVYTPVEVVDFIVHSVQDVLQKHFEGASIADKDVHILDPFTGTGTFIVRMLQSGLIPKEALKHKFTKELHANEIVLLAYYIAAVNIEAAYHGVAGGDYTPFDGIVLTDTFQLFEEGGQESLGKAFPENSARVKRQKKTPIRVIIGNPPYSVGQDSANDNNQNLKYPKLDQKIAETYALRTSAVNKNSLYDSYIRAIRWASDRIGESGIIGFVTNGAFIDSNSADGLRKCLTEEFSFIYCFNLRGNQRTSGERSRQEGGKIFGSGSRTPVAITLLIKHPKQDGPCQLHYHDIGDYLTREDKLRIVSEFGSIDGIEWQTITPNEEGDWIDQRDPLYETFVAFNDDKEGIFRGRSNGVQTNRDAWVYNSSRKGLVANVKRMIEFYNDQVKQHGAMAAKAGKSAAKRAQELVDTNDKKIKWTSGLIADLARGRKANFDPKAIGSALYRPFYKSWVYYDHQLNHRFKEKFYPSLNHSNLAIQIPGVGSTLPFSCLAQNVLPDLHTIGFGQCFPLYWYEKGDSKATKGKQGTMSFSGGDDGQPDEHGYVRRDAITDWALDHFRKHYQDKNISKEDIFYYVYGLLHSEEYRTRFASSLKKMLPRIPFAKDFKAFMKAGRDLAHWHLNYETIKGYELKEELPEEQINIDAAEFYRVKKMKWPGKRGSQDKSRIIYNSRVTLSGIPPEAYEYIVNGKSALEWVMERYQVKTDKKSGIVNDPNEYSEDPRYIVDLIKRVTRVSVETVKIVKALPELGV